MRSIMVNDNPDHAADCFLRCTDDLIDNQTPQQGHVGLLNTILESPLVQSSTQHLPCWVTGRP